MYMCVFRIITTINIHICTHMVHIYIYMVHGLVYTYNIITINYNEHMYIGTLLQVSYYNSHVYNIYMYI